VLLVEDEPSIRGVAARGAGARGYTVIAAATARTRSRPRARTRAPSTCCSPTW
jgi:DNA-binding response OmpR family regulator